MELKLLIKIKFLMDSIIFLLKLGPSLHLQFQPFPKILNSSWMSQKQCCRNILFKVKNQRKLLIVQKVKKHLSFIHNYENYCNIAWPSTTRIKIDKILKKQKHTVCIIYNKGKFTHSKLLMNALNVCQINIFQVSKFTYKAKPNLNPRVFQNSFTDIHHRHPKRFSRSSFKQPKIITNANREKRFYTCLNFLRKLKLNYQKLRIN